jgi:hypothetical protein
MSPLNHGELRSRYHRTDGAEEMEEVRVVVAGAARNIPRLANPIDGG